jgi:hypothetical protein
MPRTRLAALAATLSCVLLLGAAGTAAAQDATPLTQQVPITGAAKNGKSFKGTFTIQRFADRGGKLVATGRLTGRLKGRKISRTVSLPATVTNAAAQTSQATPPIPPSTNACQILNLVLGPIDLNLLGLRIRTNQIRLLVEGVRGPGNLLGNLLCGITGILDPPALASTPLSQLAQILDALVALSPRTA